MGWWTCKIERRINAFFPPDSQHLKHPGSPASTNFPRPGCNSALAHSSALTFNLLPPLPHRCLTKHGTSQPWAKAPSPAGGGGAVFCCRMSDAGEGAKISACGAGTLPRPEAQLLQTSQERTPGSPQVTILVQVFLADEIMRALGFTVAGEPASRHRDLRFLQVRMLTLQLFRQCGSDCSGEGRRQRGTAWKNVTVTNLPAEK